MPQGGCGSADDKDFVPGPVDATLKSMSRFGEDVRLAAARRDLLSASGPTMYGACVLGGLVTRTAYSSRSIGGESGGYTEYLLQNSDGTYSLIR
jgi:hypothetical protein